MKNSAVMGTHVRIKLAEPFEGVTHFFRGKLSGGVHNSGVFMTASGNLIHFFFQGHAWQEVRDAILNSELRIPVWRCLLLRLQWDD